MWTAIKVFGGWKVHRVLGAHSEEAPGAWRSERLALKEAARINAGGHAGAIKVIPPSPGYFKRAS